MNSIVESAGLHYFMEQTGLDQIEVLFHGLDWTSRFIILDRPISIIITILHIVTYMLNSCSYIATIAMAGFSSGQFS